MSTWPANRYLTPAMERVLRQMRGEDEELVKEEGDAFWWCGLKRVHPSTVNALHRLVLISGECGSGRAALDRFHINEDGRACLESADYVPRIIRGDSGAAGGW